MNGEDLRAMDCVIDGCEEPHRAKGLCMHHYQRKWETGDPLTPSRRKCAEGCDCGRHRRVKNPRIRTKAERREAALKHYHDITTAEYDAILLSQGGVCKVCGSAPEAEAKRSFPVDHDHSCCPGDRHCRSCIRGILCKDCNILVGFAEHQFHDEAVRYLANFKRAAA